MSVLDFEKRQPLKDYLSLVWIKVAQWFQRRIFSKKLIVKISLLIFEKKNPAKCIMF